MCWPAHTHRLFILCNPHFPRFLLIFILFVFVSFSFHSCLCCCGTSYPAHIIKAFSDLIGSLPLQYWGWSPQLELELGLGLILTLWPQLDKGPSKIRGNIHIQSCHTYWPRPNSRYQIKSLADTAWQKWVYKTTFKKIFNKKNSAMFTFSHLPYYSWYFYLFFFFFFWYQFRKFCS